MVKITKSLRLSQRLLQHFLLKVGPESAVTKGHQGLAVEVGHHLKHGVVVSPVCVVKTVRITSVKVKCVLMLLWLEPILLTQGCSVPSRPCIGLARSVRSSALQ